MSDAGLRSSLAAPRCFLRGLPLFFRSSPRTPLRVLAIIALDTVHVLRTSRPLPRKKLRELAMVLDFQACTNAAWDRKERCPAQYLATLKRLGDDGLSRYVEEYLNRLRTLESGRPPIGGDRRGFGHARAYREEVARLSLATVAAIAFDTQDLDEVFRATRCDRNVDTLFRMALLCQVIDDVVDYRADLSAGLPSYLTSTARLSDAVKWTARAARSYGAHGQGVLALRVALSAASTVAQLFVRLADRWHRNFRASIVHDAAGVETAVPSEPVLAGMDPYHKNIEPVAIEGR